MANTDDELIETLAAEMRTAFYGYADDTPEWGAGIPDRDNWLRLGRWALEFGENFMASYGDPGLLDEREIVRLLPEMLK